MNAPADRGQNALASRCNWGLSRPAAIGGFPQLGQETPKRWQCTWRGIILVLFRTTTNHITTRTSGLCDLLVSHSQSSPSCWDTRE